MAGNRCHRAPDRHSLELTHSDMEEATLMSSWNNHRDSFSQPCLLPISARHPNALNALARSYAELLTAADRPALADVCYSAGTTRAHHNYRLALTADSPEDMAAALLAFIENGRTNAGGYGKHAGSPAHGPVFVFTGMGPQ